MKSKEQTIRQVTEIIEALELLRSDESVPKNVKAKIEGILQLLKEESNTALSVSKSLHTLDEISEDLNLQPFIRTQVWNISSMFEKLNNH